jgi:hypothetical protein
MEHATHTTRQRKHIKESTPAGGCPVVDGNRFPERKKDKLSVNYKTTRYQQLINR